MSIRSFAYVGILGALAFVPLGACGSSDNGSPLTLDNSSSGASGGDASTSTGSSGNGSSGNGPQHAHEVEVFVEGDSSHQATVAFNNVYVETSTGSKGGPVLVVQSTATLTGTMNIGAPPSNDPCSGATWWPALPTVP